MDSCDEETNLMLNYVDSFRRNWLSTNEKLREANNKIEVLEAELSTVKNQLSYTTYEKDILHHTLNELRKALRADCKIIDQVQKNKSSYIRIAQHQSSISQHNEQGTAQRNLISLTTVNEINITENLPEQDVAPGNNLTPCSNQIKSKILVKKLAKAPSSTISTRKTSYLPSNVPSKIAVLSQNNWSTSEIFLEKTSHLNLKVEPKKLIESSLKIPKREFQNKAASLNENDKDVIVIDFDDETEENNAASMKSTDDIFISSDDIYLEDEDSDLITKPSTSVLKTVHSEYKINHSNSNDLINSALRSRSDFPNHKTQHLFNYSNNGQTEDGNCQKNIKEQISQTSTTRIGIKKISSISAASTQEDENPPNVDVRSSNIHLTNSKVIRKKSVSVNADDKTPIVLLPQLSTSNEILENKKTKGRKRKQLEAAKSEEMHDFKSSKKNKKPHPISSLASKPLSQNTQSSPSSSKTSLKPSKNISKQYSSQKKKK